MNTLMGFSESPHFGPAVALANDVLHLRGVNSEIFVEQFGACATCSTTVRVGGDGRTFRQALCFPVFGPVSAAGLVSPYRKLPSHLVIELMSGHVIGFRLNDMTPRQLSLVSFMDNMARFLDLLMTRDVNSWSHIEQMIEGVQRKRIKLFDFDLTGNPEIFWSDYFPQGEVRLTHRALNGLPSPGSGRQWVGEALAKIHSAHFQNACTEFADHLDTERIKAICVSGLAPKLSQYNSFLNRRANSAYRIQAAEAIPLLGYLLGVGDYRAERLRRLVDEGQPLWPALADMLSVPEETVRWLRTKTADDVGEAWLGRVHALLPDLARLAPERRPKTPDEWTAYTDFMLVLNDRWGKQGERRKAWISDLARLGWVQARQKFSNMNASPSDLLEVEDFVASLVDAIFCELQPAGGMAHDHWRSQESLAKISEPICRLFYETSILKQVRASLRWHEIQLRPPEETIDETSPDNRDLSNWPAPLSTPLTLGSLHAHFLITPGQLKEEGMRMQHCVGGYAYHCLFGGSSIVSFRDDIGRSVSTAELMLEERKQQLRMVVKQHKARKNAEPSASAAIALLKLVSMLNEEKMQAGLQQMRDQLVQRQARDTLGKRWQIFAPNAPERLRALKAALKLHVGYERFLEAGQKAMQG